MVALHVNSVHIIFALLTTFTEVGDAEESQRSAGTMKNITAVSGSAVYLPCLAFQNLSHRFDTLSIEWKNQKRLCFSRITKKTSQNQTCQSHYTMEERSGELHLSDVQLNDSGVYHCSVAGVIPPPTVDETSQVKLHVVDIIIEPQKTRNQNCTQIVCRAIGLPHINCTFSWSAERKGKQKNCSFEQTSTSLNSSVEMCDCDWSEGDTVTCHIDYSENTTRLNRSIPFPFMKERYQQDIYVIIGLSLLPVAIVLILLIVGGVIYKKRKKDGDGSIVFTNKVYENFSFSTPGSTSYLGQPQNHEHCIYDN
ncbi:hypothetical protein GN956_G24835 [Arapaima gigas]